MDNNIKDLLYDIAQGIISLIYENEKLSEENKKLKKYKQERVEEDYKYLKLQQETIGSVLSTLVENANKGGE